MDDECAPNGIESLSLTGYPSEDGCGGDDGLGPPAGSIVGRGFVLLDHSFDEIVDFLTPQRPRRRGRGLILVLMEDVRGRLSAAARDSAARFKVLDNIPKKNIFNKEHV